MTVISMRDYAKQKNISYEAVRKQVARYKNELAGHIIIDGRQQFLDEDAIAFLDAKRQKNPVSIIQQDKDERIEELESQVKQLLIKTAAQADRISELAQWKAENALLIASAEQNKILLENTQRDLKLLEGFVADAKAEISVLSHEKAEANEKARLASEVAQKAQKELTAAQAAHLKEIEQEKAAQKKAIDEMSKEMDQLLQEQVDLAQELEEKDKMILELKNRSFGDYLKGLFRKKDK